VPIVRGWGHPMIHLISFAKRDKLKGVNGATPIIKIQAIAESLLFVSKHPQNPLIDAASEGSRECRGPEPSAGVRGVPEKTHYH